MAWRPSEQLIEGELDNTVRGRVTGWMRFAGLRGKVTFDLAGDFHRDIAGCKIRLKNPNPQPHEQSDYLRGFRKLQKGEVGDITAGLPPQNYASYPYIEWYGQENGRVVLELEPEQVEVVEGPAWSPGDDGEFDEARKEASRECMGKFMTGVMHATGCRAIVVGGHQRKRGRGSRPSRN